MVGWGVRGGREEQVAGLGARLRSVWRRILCLDEWEEVRRVELGTRARVALLTAWWLSALAGRLAAAYVGSAVVALLAVWLLMVWRTLLG